MLKAMSADKYMRRGYARRGPRAETAVDAGGGALTNVRGGDGVAQREATEVQRAADDDSADPAMPQLSDRLDVLQRADPAE